MSVECTDDCAIHNIADEISHGTYGKVYTITGNDQIAIKRIEYSNCIFSESAVGMLINHSNILKFVEILTYLDCKLETNISYVMDYHPRTLYSYIVTNKQPIRIPVIYKYITNIIHGLYFLYCHDIMHLDVKPSNLLISHDDKVIIGDLGGCCFMNRQLFNIDDSIVTTFGYHPANLLTDGIRSFGIYITWYSIGIILSELIHQNEISSTKNNLDENCTIKEYANWHDKYVRKAINIFQNVIISLPSTIESMRQNELLFTLLYDHINNQANIYNYPNPHRLLKITSNGHYNIYSNTRIKNISVYHKYVKYIYDIYKMKHSLTPIPDNAPVFTMIVMNLPSDIIHRRLRLNHKFIIFMNQLHNLYRVCCAENDFNTFGEDDTSDDSDSHNELTLTKEEKNVLNTIAYISDECLRPGFIKHTCSDIMISKVISVLNGSLRQPNISDYCNDIAEFDKLCPLILSPDYFTHLSKYYNQLQPFNQLNFNVTIDNLPNFKKHLDNVA
jgi:serine/threonine protein kinase